MKKKQELTSEEAMAQVFATSYKFVFESTRSFIELYENKYKFLQREMIEHEEKEPLKIFKKTHKNWELKKEELNIELEKTFNILMEEYTDFVNLTELL